jgi:hypothetical protein
LWWVFAALEHTRAIEAAYGHQAAERVLYTFDKLGS